MARSMIKRLLQEIRYQDVMLLPLENTPEQPIVVAHAQSESASKKLPPRHTCSGSLKTAEHLEVWNFALSSETET